mmetsp:Transcript_6009/g.10311  ORF Transcript_6009/g.10311 Transcript_6009/m.10311 type:complete len:130 (-) Transcript_6009:448-837(-)|eukprot:CAMPEP_0196661448 /NCGR_PEP_ID=MMETSP1086-20130531/44368_1 /TAXON_ID=77921 /ORGANISM="Cyanoptyche  gloeocystis , Strain SAG4.97" /LENGTH=129 /DNA_ID=CAMNT_0041996351 /DNA_START=18 /DNA_END=407 /DNA_ORIENTATION=+
MEDSRVPVYFDDFNRIRILEPQKLKETEKLQEECKAFLDKTVAFSETALQIVAVIDEQARRIDVEKLKTIALRNRVDGEAEARKQKKAELQSLTFEKTQELERLVAQYESLVKAEQEQKMLIERLNNRE